MKLVPIYLRLELLLRVDDLIYFNKDLIHRKLPMPMLVVDRQFGLVSIGKAVPLTDGAYHSATITLVSHDCRHPNENEGWSYFTRPFWHSNYANDAIWKGSRVVVINSMYLWMLRKLLNVCAYCVTQNCGMNHLPELVQL